MVVIISDYSRSVTKGWHDAHLSNEGKCIKKGEMRCLKASYCPVLRAECWVCIYFFSVSNNFQNVYSDRKGFTTQFTLGSGRFTF